MNIRRRPLILISGPAAGGTVAWLFTRFSIWLAGGRARRVHPANWIRYNKHPDFDGLIVGGGADVDPKRYGQKLLKSVEAEVKKTTHLSFARFMLLFKAVLVYLLRRLFSSKPHTGFLDRARDEIELALIDRAVEEGIPVLGICRGCQLINVYFRGTLHQNIKNFYVEYPQYKSVLPKKRVTLEEDSQLYKVLKRKSVRVNALHNQAVHNVSPFLRVAAREGNGVVQAVEAIDPNMPVIGVQWHPEFLFQKSEQRALFRWMVAKAAERRARKDSHASSKLQTKPYSFSPLLRYGTDRAMDADAPS